MCYHCRMNEHNLICTAFAFKEGFDTSLQLGQKASNSTTSTYLKNILVTLASAKLCNPDAAVVLFTNTDVPSEWSSSFSQAGISTQVCPFDSFVISKDYTWALAYYKLCVLSHIVGDNSKNRKYDHILLMDADTYSARAYDELWKEADLGVLMYEVGHSYDHRDREIIRKDFVKFYPDEAKNTAIVHYGGEFIAGKQEYLLSFLDTCSKVFHRMTGDENLKLEQKAGDETIWSVAAALTDVPILHAGAYIYRFWTQDFYLVSTVTESNPVCIWHVPSEKEDGFLRLYEYYKAHRSFPSVRKAASYFGIPSAKRKPSFLHFLFKVKKKLWIKNRK